MHNWYQIIGVNKDATKEAIKKAYKRKALSEHPDRGGTKERMILLTAAYEILSNQYARKVFDEEWKIFNASNDPEIPVTLSGCLPTAGTAFSKCFRELHAEYVKQCNQKPLDQNESPHLEAFRSELYNGNTADDLFSFIKAKSHSETKLSVGRLTPEKAVEYFISFLQGDYSRNNLRDLGKAFYKEIKQLETSGQFGNEFKLFCGIYEIILVAVKEKTPSLKILFSLQKITEYAKHNPDETMIFMAPLFQSKYFRSLFSQALHYYWLSEENALYERTDFDGVEAFKNSIESLKSQLFGSRNASNCEQKAELLRYVRLLYKLEQDMDKKANTTTANLALFYREKAFHLLDWLPSLNGFADRAIIVNTWLQIGITMQRAAAEEPNPVLCMADEKLATQIFYGATEIGRHATPDVELYACLHSLKCLSCRYTDSAFKTILKSLQHRALWLADLFPFFQTPQSNADFYEKEDKTLVLMRNLLHELINKIDGQEDPVKKGVIDHDYVRVFYQAYEAILKNWYENNHDPGRENTFRLRLMKELLDSKQWTIDNINYNLNAPWSLSYLDEGWTSLESSILPLVKEANIPTYKTVYGAELNYKTGKIDFIFDSCEDKDSDHNRLLTFLDLIELFQCSLTSAFFSLDCIDPGKMPYHPFNQMRFKPSTLYHSQLLHTMLLTDYLLKFFTVGQEVQRRYPYELRCLDRITSKLPDHLKKVIYNFHPDHHEESYSRFWIESEGVELAIDEEGLNNDGNVLISLGNIRMVVKYRKMELDAEGNLVDKAGENEGWNCFILTREQKQELYDGKRFISDSALIIIKDSFEVNVWENDKTTHCITLEDDTHDLISLGKLKRDSREKVKTDDWESLSLVYQIVMKVACKTGIPHRYTSEFIFAQEFTKYYDEYAIYYPEFGRLRELSKAVCLVNIMEKTREQNKEEASRIRRLLNYKKLCGLQSDQRWQTEEHAYWQKTSKLLEECVEECINKQFQELHAKFSKEKLEERRKDVLNDIRLKIGPLKFTRYSPEIKSICDELYGEIKKNYIAAHGYFSWLCESDSRIYREGIDPHIPSMIHTLENKKKSACREQLLTVFKNELDDLSRQEASLLVDEFLEDDDELLIKQLVYYDRIQIAKEIKEIYPEHTINILDNALNNNVSALDEIKNCETIKALEKHEQQLKVQLSGKEKLEKSFIDLGFGDYAEEINLDGTCLWIPASFRHDVEKGQSRAVYGGVLISGMALNCIDRNRVRALSRQTREEGKRMLQNNIRGNAVETFAALYLNLSLSSNSKIKIEEQVVKKTPLGLRIMDIVIDKVGEDGVARPVLAFEIKSGDSEYTTKQKLKDKWIKQNYGIPTFEIRFPTINKDYCKIQ